MSLKSLYQSVFAAKAPIPPPASTPLVVTEGIGGQWHYHLSRAGATTRALCGSKTMHTALPLSGWGIVTHLHERYCQDCARQAAQEHPDIDLPAYPA